MPQTLNILNVKMENVIITVKVPKTLRDELRKHGVKIDIIVREALEKELKKRENQELKKAAEQLGKLFRKIPTEKIVKTIKEDRRIR